MRVVCGRCQELEAASRRCKQNILHGDGFTPILTHTLAAMDLPCWLSTLYSYYDRYPKSYTIHIPLDVHKLVHPGLGNDYFRRSPCHHCGEAISKCQEEPDNNALPTSTCSLFKAANRFTMMITNCSTRIRTINVAYYNPCIV